MAVSISEDALFIERKPRDPSISGNQPTVCRDGNPQARRPASSVSKVRTEYKRSISSNASYTRLRASVLIATFPSLSARTKSFMDSCDRCSPQPIEAK